MVLNGPDASHHNGTINWPQVSTVNAFAIIKATEGSVYSWTSWFNQEWPRLRASGLVTGAYHFLRSDSDPAAQARFYVNTVQDFTDVLAVVDVETGSNNSLPTDTHTRTFKAEFNRLVPNHPLMVYTGRWYWRDTIGNPTGVDIGPLWHSAYSSSPGSMYGKWPTYTMWQWTNQGTCPGISGPCDMNRFPGTMADLIRLTKPTTEEDMPLTDADLDAIEARVDLSGKRSTMFIMDGRQNSVYNPAVKGNEWMTTAVDIKETKTAVLKAVSDCQAAILAAIEALPSGPGGTLGFDDVVAAVKKAGREGTGIV